MNHLPLHELCADCCIDQVSVDASVSPPSGSRRQWQPSNNVNCPKTVGTVGSRPVTASTPSFRKSDTSPTNEHTPVTVMVSDDEKGVTRHRHALELASSTLTNAELVAEIQQRFRPVLSDSRSKWAPLALLLVGEVLTGLTHLLLLLQTVHGTRAVER